MSLVDALQLFALLVFAHALADYPLQGDFLAKAKAGAFAPAVPWWQAMGAHVVIHGGFVMLATGSLLLGTAEAVCHGLIDWAKCRGVLSFNEDQALHLLCKVMWVIAVVVWGGA